MPYLVIIYVAIYIMKKLDIVAQSHPNLTKIRVFVLKFCKIFNHIFIILSYEQRF